MKITVDLFNLDKLSAELDRYSNIVDNIVDVVLKDMAEKGESYMKATYIAGHPQSQSNGNNIQTFKIPNGYRIEDTSPHAEFAEYGTGVKGQTNPHPDLPASWTYNTSGKPYWWYPTTATDPNTSKFQNEKGDYIAATKGVVGSQHAWKTYQMINNIITKEIENKVGGIR